MITPPSNQNRVLLFIETQVTSMVCAAVIAAIFNALHSQLQHTPSPFPAVFGALSGTSAVALSMSIAAAMQKHSYCITYWHIFFHAPFAIAIVGSALLVSEGYSTALSELQGAFVGGTILVVLLLVYKCLDIPYTNMTLAAARASDEAGLYYLHHICRWVIRGISALQDLVTRSRSQNSTSGTELKPLRNIQSWYPEMAEIPSEETPLGDGSDIGEKLV
ncbi:hypothetical protein OG21DRAFT_1498543 [Imleria badia]|nr:hypothetical protein OG21DRAFT_1498543 [Imleria badia]